MEKEVEMPKIYLVLFSIILLVCGIILYISWAAANDAWSDIGLYSVVVILIGLGLSGIFLFTRKPVEEEDQ